MVQLYIRLLTGRLQVRILLAELTSSEPQAFFEVWMTRIRFRKVRDFSLLGELSNERLHAVRLLGHAGMPRPRRILAMYGQADDQKAGLPRARTGAEAQGAGCPTRLHRSRDH